MNDRNNNNPQPVGSFAQIINFLYAMLDQVSRYFSVDENERNNDGVRWLGEFSSFFILSIFLLLPNNRQPPRHELQPQEPNFSSLFHILVPLMLLFGINPQDDENNRPIVRGDDGVLEEEEGPVINRFMRVFLSILTAFTEINPQHVVLHTLV